ncbi:MAG: hypothetical protein ACRDOO_24635 [Actinomadura sp.]
MDTVVLRRRGWIFVRMRPLNVAAACLGLAGGTGLALVTMGWPPFFPVWIWLVAIIAFVLYPHTVFAADRTGLSFGTGRRRPDLPWDQVAQIVVADGPARGPAPDPGVRPAIIAIRAQPGGMAPARRPWDGLLDTLDRLQPGSRWRRTRRDKPFTLAHEETFPGQSAAELASRLRAVASAPVTQATEIGDDRLPYLVRQPFRSVLPAGIFFLAWNASIGSVFAAMMIAVSPRAAIPLAVVGVGAVLMLVDILTPEAALAANRAGLLFDGEFLAWNEITEICLGSGSDGTELVVRLDPGAPAALTEPGEPEIRRLLRHVHIDIAQLAGALPPHVRAAAIPPA